MKLESVCVYCGSFSSAKQVYKDAAVEMGTALGQAGLGMVYGGSIVGLMGLCADSAVKAGSKVVGVAPAFLAEREPPHPGLAELIVVGDMHTRKRLMADRADGFVIMPGGFGTLDEFAEILTWRQLGLHHKPIVGLNINNYWKALREQMDYMCAEGFIKPEHRELVGFVDTVDEVIPELRRLCALNLEALAKSDGPAPAHDEVLSSKTGLDCA